MQRRTCVLRITPATSVGVDPQSRGGGVVTQKLCRVRKTSARMHKMPNFTTSEANCDKRT